jgi:hypothetical protein
MNSVEYLLLTSRLITLASKMGDAARHYEFLRDQTMWELRLLEAMELLTQMRLEAKKGVHDVLAGY